MININLNNIKSGGDTWLVKFNPNKTEIMIFNIRNQQDELSFDFDGIILNSAQTFWETLLKLSYDIG
jgi:hypothetical protein